MLHSYSLLVPPIAARIRTELVEVPDTPSGRFAELIVITELLHAATRGDHLALAEPLRRRASLLGRSTPALLTLFGHGIRAIPRRQCGHGSKR